MKNLSVCCLILSFCFLPLLTRAQGADMLDVLYLRSGEVIEGKIITLIPNELVVIETKTGVQTAYVVDDVLRVVQAQAKEEPVKVKAKPIIYIPPTQGWYNVTNVGMLNGRTAEESHVGVSVNNITGYLFHHRVGIGVGVGVDNYVPGSGETLYPVFAEVRGYFNPEKHGLFYAVSAGYGFAFANENFFVNEAEGGAMYHPQLGFRFLTSEALQVLVTVGAKFQNAVFERQDLFRGGTETLTLRYQRITLGVGISF